MESVPNDDGTVTPFPALTPGQRLFLEVNGYVVVENTLSADEVGRIRDALYSLQREFQASDDPLSHRVHGCHVGPWEPPLCHFAHLLETDPAIFDYLTHPRIVALAEELVGGKVRLEESAAFINRREPAFDSTKTYQYNFHRGGQPGFDSYQHDDLYHCTFVKALTNLTDMGPDDGGTTVIAGSHKLNCNEHDMVAAAYETSELIHQVVAPTGSTILMCETLIHATGQIRSERERVIIIAGFSHPKHAAVAGWEPTPAFLEMVSEQKKQLVAGHPYWTWPERHRKLGMPAMQKSVPYKARMWSVSHDA